MTPETPIETTLETVSPSYSPSDQSESAIASPRQSPHPHPCRLPRFVRAKPSHRPPLALQDRDLDLLRAAYAYRLISTPQYLLLFADESRDGIYRRLQRLFHHGYLDRIGSNPNAPLVYALGPRGAEELGVPYRSEAGERYIAHRLMVGDFRTVVTLDARARGIEFSWRTVPLGLPVRPDGFFGLRFPDLPDGRNRAYFFLECDRSTMTRERFVEKLLGYWAWCRERGHTERLGIRTFRVLTVVKSEQRLASLLGAASRAPGLESGLGHFWFTSENRFTPTESPSIFGAIWERPDRPDERHTILPAELP